MEHYYLNELNFDELNEYRKTYYRSLTLYKIVIKEHAADYTKNHHTSFSPIYDILNLKKSEELPLLTQDGCKLLTFLALGNNELPIDLRFVKKDGQEMLRLKINPVTKSIHMTVLEWDDNLQKYTINKSRSSKINKEILQDPSVKNLLERIYIGTEDKFGFFYFPRKKV